MNTESDISVPPKVLQQLEGRVRRALRSGDDDELEVLGYGEISCVLGVEVDGASLAAKRLPRFEDRRAFGEYQDLFEQYLVELNNSGVQPVRSDLQVVDDDKPGIQAYCLQPRLDAEAVGPEVLRNHNRSRARQFLRDVVDATADAVDDRLGIDAQLSNWVITDEGLRYLDVTTPMLRASDGEPLLDTDMFLASLPWALRGVVDAFLVEQILEQYHQRRRVLLDMAANLYKERLTGWIPTLLEWINRRVSPPVTLQECRRYYRRDALMWEVLLRLRRLDERWQRKVRRRPYPFLLPGDIQR